jgi:hypothetical protein
VIRARRQNHLNDPALISRGQFTPKCQINHVTERAMLHQILHAVTAYQYFVPLDSGQ